MLRDAWARISPTPRLSRLFERDVVQHPDHQPSKHAVSDTQPGPGHVIFSYLSKTDLLNFRLASRHAAQIVHRAAAPRMFATLFARFDSEDARHRPSISALRGIGAYCQNMIIRLAPITSTRLDEDGTLDDVNRSPASTLDAPAERDGNSSLSSARILYSAALPWETARPSYWEGIFDLVPHVTKLTISCPGLPPWSGYLAVEQSLVAIRQALESSSSLEALRCFRLDPIHALGLLHCRWSGLAAYGNAAWTAGARWRKIKELDISLANPAGLLTKDHQKIFVKVLHDYLASFSHTIEGLSLRWIGRVGPNPLHLEETTITTTTATRPGREHLTSSFSAVGLRWRRLKRLRLRHCRCDVRTIRTLFVDRAPSLTQCVVRGDLVGSSESFEDLRWARITCIRSTSHNQDHRDEDVWRFERLSSQTEAADLIDLGLVRFERPKDARLEAAAPISRDILGYENKEDDDDDDHFYGNIPIVFIPGPDTAFSP